MSESPRGFLRGDRREFWGRGEWIPILDARPRQGSRREGRIGDETRWGGDMLKVTI